MSSHSFCFRPSRALLFVGAAMFFGSECFAATNAGEAKLPSAPSINRGSLRGVVIPISNVQLPARAAGIIERFGAEEGQHVQKGDLLVQLNADIERADLSRAEAILEIANSELERAKRELDRSIELFQKNSIGSKKDFEDVQSLYQLATGRRKQALADVAMAEARLKERTITASFDGTLFRRTKSIGEGVERLEPVINLLDSSKLEFVIYGSAELLGRFQLGKEGRILVESGPASGTTVVGVVSYIDPTMDPSTSTFRVKFNIEPSQNVLPGILATLQLPSEVN